MSQEIYCAHIVLVLLTHLQCIVSERFRYIRLANSLKQDSLAEAVQKKLRSAPRSIPPMFFYDHVGSQLFEEICSLPEYYQTRTETAILRAMRYELSGYLHERFRLVELGSGSSVKTRCVLDSLQDAGAGSEYVPIDISDALENGAGSLLDDYPKLHITGIVDTYEHGLSIVRHMSGSPNLIIFLGSSLGNMSASESISFLRTIRASMKGGDLLLLGLDMDKDVAALEAAYNDTRGVTAKFNLNILHRLNRELGANFDVSKFSHCAPYNKSEKRIEMYLKSMKDQSVDIPGANTTIYLKKDELIHTENSQKYTMPHIQTMADSVNLKIKRIWQDAARKFSVTLMSA